MPTIAQANQQYHGKPGRALELAVRRAIQAGRLPQETPVGANQPFTPDMAAALGLPYQPATDTAAPQAAYESTEAPTPQPPATPKPRKAEPVAVVPARTATERVFDNPPLFVGMLIIICIIDGAAMMTIAAEVIADTLVIRVVMFAGGTIVAYAGLQNAYTLSRTRTSTYENPASTWVVVFTSYQVVLHASASNFFGTYNEVVSQVIIAFGIPISTAALSVLLFHNPIKATTA